MTDSIEARIRAFAEELAKNPKSKAFVPLADAYRQLGRYEEAVQVARKGLAIFPHYVAAKLALARACFENGDADPAAQLLEDVLHTAPDNLLANRILAEVYSEKGERDKAIPLLKKLLALEPGDEWSANRLQALEGPVSAPEPRSPPKPGIRTATLAEMYRSQGHEKEALEIYEELAGDRARLLRLWLDRIQERRRSHAV
jgi:FimV-like protein